MGVLVCKKCGANAEADTQEKANEIIDHAATKVKCEGTEDLELWYPKGIPKPVPDTDIDPHRAIQGLKVTVSKSSDIPSKSPTKGRKH